MSNFLNFFVKKLYVILLMISVPVSLVYAQPERLCLPWAIGGVACDACVDKSCQLCSEEKSYIAARTPLVELALKKFIGFENDTTIQTLPRLGFCCSGGGYRAMISMLGFLSGMKHLGLTDATTYVATLSGSAWCYIHYLLRKKLQKIDLFQFREILQQRVKEPLLDMNCYDSDKFLDKIVSVLSERGKIEAADFLGAIAANRLWGDLDQFQTITFSPLREAFSASAVAESSFMNEPFPLCSLVISDVFPYEWLELNPYVTGSDYLGGYIPTALFDSYFKSGRCVEDFSEKSLGWFLAMVGSAYNFSLGDVLLTIAKKSGNAWFLDLVKAFVNTLNLYEDRVLSSPVYNFVWGMNNRPLADRREFEISDAGIDFNLPFPLLFKKERAVDIIFVCEASLGADIETYPDLYFAQNYMERKGIKFPPLDDPKKISDNILLFEDEHDTTIPVIVYFVNPVGASTLEFAYTKEEFYEMHDAMKYVVLESEEAIKAVIDRRVKRTM